jgi:hypothetical protein
MRNPKRIRRILGRIERLWSLYPDLRLGQLIKVIECNPKRRSKAETFHIEDDEWEELIEDKIKEWS